MLLVCLKMMIKMSLSLRDTIRLVVRQRHIGGDVAFRWFCLAFVLPFFYFSRRKLKLSFNALSPPNCSAFHGKLFFSTQLFYINSFYSPTSTILSHIYVFFSGISFSCSSSSYNFFLAFFYYYFSFSFLNFILFHHVIVLKFILN